MSQTVVNLAPYAIVLIVAIFTIFKKVRLAKTGKEIIGILLEEAPEVVEKVNTLLIEAKVIKNDRKNDKKE